LNDLKVTNSFKPAVAVMVLAGIVTAFCFGWPHGKNAARGTAAQTVAIPTAKSAALSAADNGDMILHARTGVDEVVNVSIAPDLIVPGYGLVVDDSDGDDVLLAYPATS
jgi:hypothetical protein